MAKSKIFLEYVPAELSEGKEWYVRYYAKHPQSGKLTLRRIKINRIKSITERRKFGRMLVHELNVKLAEGWNPFIVLEAPKAYTLMSTALDAYLTHRGGAADTQRVYRSIISMIRTWLTESKKPKNLYIASFDKKMAIEYLQWLVTKRKVTERTWNNYMLFSRTIWNWFIEYQYCTANPFEGFKRKKVRKKTRIPLPPEERAAVKDWFLENNKTMYIACALIFAAGTRRTELTKLRVGHFDLIGRSLTLPAEITKVGTERTSLLPIWLADALIAYGLDKAPKHWYIMGRGWRCNDVAVQPKQLTDWWTRMRKALKLPEEYQLYSLRDTGVQTMLRAGVPPELVRDQFGHASISETNKYTVNVLPGTRQIMDEKVKEF